MLNRCTYCLISLFLTLQATPSFAASPCPARVGYLEGNALTQLVLPIMKDIYQELGCSTRFVQLPGRRSLIAFNKQKIDAELMRLPLAESKYTVAFTRSTYPIFQLYSYLWVNPNKKRVKHLPYGYVKGTLWQERYAKNKNFAAFYNTKNLLRAYNAKQIAGFLGSGTAIRKKIKNNTLHPVPIPIIEANKAPLYHYTQADYKKFLLRLDTYLEKHQPFAALKNKLSYPLPDTDPQKRNPTETKKKHFSN